MYMKSTKRDHRANQRNQHGYVMDTRWIIDGSMTDRRDNRCNQRGYMMDP